MGDTRLGRCVEEHDEDHLFGLLGISSENLSRTFTKNERDPEHRREEVNTLNGDEMPMSGAANLLSCCGIVETSDITDSMNKQRAELSGTESTGDN